MKGGTIVRQDSTGIPIKVKIKTHIEQDGKFEDFSFNEDGLFFQKGTAIYIRYQETNPLGKVPVTMKFADDGTIQLRRHASSDLRLVFDVKQKMLSKYRTPAGLMDIITDTKLINFKYQEVPLNGDVAIDYNLIAGEEVVGQYKIRLQFIQ